MDVHGDARLRAQALREAHMIAVSVGEHERGDIIERAVALFEPVDELVEVGGKAGIDDGESVARVDDPSKTEADIGRWAAEIESTGRMPAGPVPATFVGAIQTIPSGTSVYLTADFEAGPEYVLSDDQSGAMARFTPS